jgi:hypothetical protein
MKVLLDYYSARKLTISHEGDVFASFVAMAFKQREVSLPGGETGIELRYMVNSPERFEHVIICRPVAGDADYVTVEQVPNNALINENIYLYSFEPLTMEAWKTMNVEGRDELEKELKTDAELRNYYWNDWVPEYWTEEFQPWV